MAAWLTRLPLPMTPPGSRRVLLMVACLRRSPLPMTPPGSRRVLVKPATAWRCRWQTVTIWGVSRAWGWAARARSSAGLGLGGEGAGPSPGLSARRASWMEPGEARVGAASGVGASPDQEGPRGSTTSVGRRGRGPGKRIGTCGGLLFISENCLSTTGLQSGLTSEAQGKVSILTRSLGDSDGNLEALGVVQRTSRS